MNRMIAAMLVVIFAIWALFRITGLFFRLAGHLIGALAGIFGFLLLGIAAVTLLGFAFYALPVILLIGAGTVVTELIR